MNIARYFHTATLLPNGKVLVTGGIVTGGSTKTAELYDPSANTWTLIASMTTNRSVHSATLLPNGKVLVAGGFAGNPLVSPANALASAELYDPTTGTWTSTSPMTTPRGYHKAALAAQRASAPRRRQRQRLQSLSPAQTYSRRPRDSGPRPAQ